MPSNQVPQTESRNATRKLTETYNNAVLLTVTFLRIGRSTETTLPAYFPAMLTLCPSSMAAKCWVLAKNTTKHDKTRQNTTSEPWPQHPKILVPIVSTLACFTLATLRPLWNHCCCLTKMWQNLCNQWVVVHKIAWAFDSPLIWAFFTVPCGSLPRSVIFDHASERGRQTTGLQF